MGGAANLGIFEENAGAVTVITSGWGERVCGG